MAQSIFQRKRDFVYLVFFITHLPVMLAFDLTPSYPGFLHSPWMSNLHAWYLATYGDRFFTPSSPAWFPALSFLEFAFHLPVTIWAIPALLRADPRVPLVLLVFGMETVMSTLVCFVEMRSWAELEDWQRGVAGLGGMYGAYLALGFFMVVDCWNRLDRWIASQEGKGGMKKRV